MFWVTFRFWRLAEARVQRYICASTVYVYSRDGGFYRCSKQAAEQYVRSINELWLRLHHHCYGSLYGPRSDSRNGLWRIVKNALETGTVSYEGSPEARAEYIHVEDAALSSVDALGEEFLNQHVLLTGHQPMPLSICSICLLRSLACIKTQ